MGDPLHDLEERLERLVPQSLSDSGRARLDDMIDELAAGSEPAGQSGGQLRKIAALAAVLVASAVGVIVGFGERGGEPIAVAAKAATPAPETTVPTLTETGFETVDYHREVEDGRDGGIVLSRFDEPMRSHLYNIREMELILDKESGLEVRIVSERKEAVLTAVTSF